MLICNKLRHMDAGTASKASSIPTQIFRAQSSASSLRCIPHVLAVQGAAPMHCCSRATQCACNDSTLVSRLLLLCCAFPRHASRRMIHSIALISVALLTTSMAETL